MGGFADDEIPLLVMLFYLFRGVEPSRSYGDWHFDYKQIPVLFYLAIPRGPYRDSALLIRRL